MVIGETLSDGFWDIIESAGRDERTLKTILWAMSEEEVANFHKEFVIAASVLRGEPFESLLGGTESEDGIMDIAYWVVAQGRQRYEATLKNPKSIPRHVDVGDPAVLHHVTVQVFHEKFGKSLDFF
jgi:hypothetical protein